VRTTSARERGPHSGPYFGYAFRRDEFLKHDHKRSSVESTCSAVKRTFGDALRSRSDVAMATECLCKFVAHNLTCVILSQIELGIDATFWDAKDEPPADVLPLARAG
jgi:hypothetical protein